MHIFMLNSNFKMMVQSCIVMTDGLCRETAVNQTCLCLQLLQKELLYMA